MKKVLVIMLVVIMAVSMTLVFVGCDTGSTITVGVTDYAPMNYMEDGEWTGFDTELARQVFTALGYKHVVFKEINWEQKYTELASGSIQCIWNGFTSDGVDMIDDVEVSRRDSVDFSYNYMMNQQCVVMLSENIATYTTVESLGSVTCAVEAGSAGANYASSLTTDTYIKEATSQRAALQEVLSKTSTYAVIDKLMAESMVGTGNFASLAINTNFVSDKEYYAVGFKKGSELTSQVNAQLEKMATDGSLLTLATTYGLEFAVITDYSDQK